MMVKYDIKMSRAFKFFSLTKSLHPFKCMTVSLSFSLLQALIWSPQALTDLCAPQMWNFSLRNAISGQLIIKLAAIYICDTAILQILSSSAHRVNGNVNLQAHSSFLSCGPVGPVGLSDHCAMSVLSVAELRNTLTVHSANLPAAVV